jgi:hypothetical protein
MSSAKRPGQVEITFRYSRHVGPRYVHGGLTLKFDSLQPYAFMSHARWPSTANYETAIREAVEQVLKERQGHTESTLVVLTHVEWEEVDSCEVGFKRAAAAATRAAFEV